MALAIGQSSLGPEKLSRFCDIRYHAVSEFEALLERAYSLAEQLGFFNLAVALHRNLCDERGLDYISGAPNGQGAHSSWRHDFLSSLGIADAGKNPLTLYQFSETDPLPLLIGIVLAAEFTISVEDARLLKSLREAFPSIFILG